ncbi:MAG: hypothetical protein UT05_C0012G0013 [Parcubacteria group bacterium GW2011_GWF2_38_76]|nr:MAG: hypothetical protein UT05_C0012G0013 [Parcubacteria group bacterium GW2011_GWF2_38_76]HBM46063.1 hypothetical protein [Patescibacteria group bacterium]
MGTITLVLIGVSLLALFYFNKKENHKISLLFLHLETKIKEGVIRLKSDLRKEINKLTSEKEIKKIVRKALEENKGGIDNV